MRNSCPDALKDLLRAETKTKEVRDYFEHIARNYDLANMVMSFGRHHYWRRCAVSRLTLQPGNRVLDLCCGTGMITGDIARGIGAGGQTVGLDFSEEMLAVARQRLERHGLLHRVNLVKGDASRLPFAENHFDRVVIGYGLRNVADPAKVLEEMFRVLKPGGKMVVLETARPRILLVRKVYYFYMSKWFPLVGKLLSRHEEAYRYLYESIVDFPPPEEFIETINRVGFINTKYVLLTMGAVAVYQGYKSNNTKWNGLLQEIM